MTTQHTAELLRAIRFATIAHGEQKRKYTGAPYITHPLDVAERVARVGGSDAMVIAAVLHDVVEDTHVTHDEIEISFGPEVGDLVYWLTDVSIPSDGNRAKRKEIDRQHIAGAPVAAQTIKLADLISNSICIMQHDPDFAVVYMREKARLLDVLIEGDPTLHQAATELVEEWYSREGR